jgi:hypothetical protein
MANSATSASPSAPRSLTAPWPRKNARPRPMPKTNSGRRAGGPHLANIAAPLFGSNSAGSAAVAAAASATSASSTPRRRGRVNSQADSAGNAR